MTPQQPSDNVSRRNAIRAGAGLVGLPMMMATTPLAQATAADGEDRRLEDPKGLYPSPPFKKQPQAWPGLASKMDPVPDHGEKSYRGSAV